MYPVRKSTNKEALNKELLARALQEKNRLGLLTPIDKTIDSSALSALNAYRDEGYQSPKASSSSTPILIDNRYLGSKELTAQNATSMLRKINSSIGRSPHSTILTQSPIQPKNISAGGKKSNVLPSLSLTSRDIEDEDAFLYGDTEKLDTPSVMPITIVNIPAQSDSLNSAKPSHKPEAEYKSFLQASPKVIPSINDRPMKSKVIQRHSEWEEPIEADNYGTNPYGVLTDKFQRKEDPSDDVRREMLKLEMFQKILQANSIVNEPKCAAEGDILQQVEQYLGSRIEIQNPKTSQEPRDLSWEMNKNNSFPDKSSEEVVIIDEKLSSIRPSSVQKPNPEELKKMLHTQSPPHSQSPSSTQFGMRTVRIKPKVNELLKDSTPKETPIKPKKREGSRSPERYSSNKKQDTYAKDTKYYEDTKKTFPKRYSLIEKKEKYSRTSRRERRSLSKSSRSPRQSPTRYKSSAKKQSFYSSSSSEQERKRYSSRSSNKSSKRYARDTSPSSSSSSSSGSSGSYRHSRRKSRLLKLKKKTFPPSKNLKDEISLTKDKTDPQMSSQQQQLPSGTLTNISEIAKMGEVHKEQVDKFFNLIEKNKVEPDGKKINTILSAPVSNSNNFVQMEQTTSSYQAPLPYSSVTPSFNENYVLNSPQFDPNAHSYGSYFTLPPAQYYSPQHTPQFYSTPHASAAVPPFPAPPPHLSPPVASVPFPSPISVSRQVHLKQVPITQWEETGDKGLPKKDSDLLLTSADCGSSRQDKVKTASASNPPIQENNTECEKTTAVPKLNIIEIYQSMRDRRDQLNDLARKCKDKLVELKREKEQSYKDLGYYPSKLTKAIDKTKEEFEEHSEKSKRAKSKMISIEKKIDEILGRTKPDDSKASSKVAFELNKVEVKYAFFDPGDHVCLSCSRAFNTIGEKLSHLHSEEHRQFMSHLESYWPVPGKEEAPSLRITGKVVKKRQSFKGSELIVPTNGFYCQVCNKAFQDSSYTVEHLKAVEHSEMYQKYIETKKNYEKNYESRKNAALLVIKNDEKRILEGKKSILGKFKNADPKSSSQFGTDEEEEEATPPFKPVKMNFTAKKKSFSETKKSYLSDQKVVYIGRAPNYKRLASTAEKKTAQIVAAAAAAAKPDQLASKNKTEDSLNETYGPKTLEEEISSQKRKFPENDSGSKTYVLDARNLPLVASSEMKKKEDEKNTETVKVNKAPQQLKKVSDSLPVSSIELPPSGNEEKISTSVPPVVLGKEVDNKEKKRCTEEEDYKILGIEKNKSMPLAQIKQPPSVTMANSSPTPMNYHEMQYQPPDGSFYMPSYPPFAQFPRIQTPPPNMVFNMGQFNYPPPGMRPYSFIPPISSPNIYRYNNMPRYPPYYNINSQAANALNQDSEQERIPCVEMANATNLEEKTEIPRTGSKESGSGSKEVEKNQVTNKAEIDCQSSNLKSSNPASIMQDALGDVEDNAKAPPASVPLKTEADTSAKKGGMPEEAFKEPPNPIYSAVEDEKQAAEAGIDNDKGITEFEKNEVASAKLEDLEATNRITELKKIEESSAKLEDLEATNKLKKIEESSAKLEDLEAIKIADLNMELGGNADGISEKEESSTKLKDFESPKSGSDTDEYNGSANKSP